MSGTITGRDFVGEGQKLARVRIVTDSSSDILPHHARAIGVVVVPNWIVLDGRALRDGVEITAAQFYAQLPHARTVPYTQPASVDDFGLAYQWLFQQGATAILSIHLSARLRRVVEHAAAARDALSPAPIDVIDSRLSGIALWPAITHAAALAGRGAPPQRHALSTGWSLRTTSIASVRCSRIVSPPCSRRRVSRVSQVSRKPLVSSELNRYSPCAVAC